MLLGGEGEAIVVELEEVFNRFLRLHAGNVPYSAAATLTLAYANMRGEMK